MLTHLNICKNTRDDFLSSLIFVPDAVAICSCSSIGRTSTKDKRRSGGWRRKENLASGFFAGVLPSSFHPTPQISFRVTGRLIFTVCKPIPLHWPDRATLHTGDETRLEHLKTSSRPHKCISLALQIKSPLVHAHRASHARTEISKILKFTIICRVNTCFDLL